MLKRLQLEYRLKELGMTKIVLAKKLGLARMTLHSRFNDPRTFKVGELEIMTRIGFFESIIFKL